MFPPLPKNLVIPDGTGRFLADAAGPLRPVGPPLIVSNSPEQVTDRCFNNTHGFALLHRVQLPDSRFRLFYHHQVITRHAVSFGCALINHGTQPLDLYISRSSGPVLQNDPVAAGAYALQNYLSGKAFGTEEDRYLSTLHPNSAFFLTDLAESGKTATNMIDLALRDPTGRMVTSYRPPVTLVMVADGAAFFRSTQDRLVMQKALLHAPVVAPDPVRSQRTRATFAHANREGVIRCVIGPDEKALFPLFVDLAGPYSGPDARPLRGEFERPLTPQWIGVLPEGNPGNYGVVYDLRVVLTNRFLVPIGVSCLLNAAGGPGGSVLGLDEGVRSPRTFLNAFESWVWQEVTLAPGASRTVPVRFSLPGGANGAQRLFFWPRVIPT